MKLYKVITNPDIYGFQRDINSYLHDGYELCGGVGINTDDGGHTFAQAVTKTSSAEKQNQPPVDFEQEMDLIYRMRGSNGLKDLCRALRDEVEIKIRSSAHE